MQRPRRYGAPPSSLLHQWHQLTRSTIIKPGLQPCSKLLFGDKSILQSQADGHLARSNRSLSLVSLWRAPLTDVEPHQTCWLTRTVGRTKRGRPEIRESYDAPTFEWLLVDLISCALRLTTTKKENTQMKWNRIQTRPRLHLNKVCQDLKRLNPACASGICSKLHNCPCYYSAATLISTTAGGADVTKEFKWQPAKPETQGGWDICGYEWMTA